MGGEQWVKEVKHYNAKARILLVGMKSDLRAHTPATCVSVEEATTLAREMGAKEYIEVSALTSSKVSELLNEVIPKAVLG